MKAKRTKVGGKVRIAGVRRANWHMLIRFETGACERTGKGEQNDKLREETQEREESVCVLAFAYTCMCLCVCICRKGKDPIQQGEKKGESGFAYVRRCK